MADKSEDILIADHSYVLGDFQLVLNEDTNELKIFVRASKNRLIIKPNTDNSCTLVSGR